MNPFKPGDKLKCYDKCAQTLAIYVVKEISDKPFDEFLTIHPEDATIINCDCCDPEFLLHYGEERVHYKTCEAIE